MTERTSRKPSASRLRQEARILSAAEQAFSSKGFSGTSMDAVAEAVGISKQNMIYYFPSKEILYRRVLQNVLDLWIQKMSFIDASDTDQAAMIAAYIRGKLELSRDHPHGSRVFAHEIINGAPVLKDYLLSHLKPQFERDTAQVQSWIDAGKIDPIDPKHLFFVIWSSTQTYADFTTQITLLLDKPELDHDDFESAIEFLTQVILKGIGASK